MSDRSAVLRALAAFGVDPGADVVPMPAEARWRVRAEGADREVYRHPPGSSPAAIRWQHDLLRFAAERGWPVALPATAADGSTVVDVDGALYTMAAVLPGAPLPRGSRAAAHITGRLMARLHRDLSGFGERGQRPGSGRAWELDLLVEGAAAGSFNELLARFADDHRELAAAVRRERYRNLRELARLGYGDLPDVVVHGAFHGAGLRFVDGRLSGLLGFDLARRDAAATDLAAALAGECIHGTDVDLHLAEALVAGYAEHRALDRGEYALLPALVRSHLLLRTAARLVEWRLSGSERAVSAIAATVENEFPALAGSALRLGSLQARPA